MHRDVTAVLLLLFLGTAFSPVGMAQENSSSARSAAAQLYARGVVEFGQRNYLSALALFVDAREAGIAGPAVHYNIGVCQFRLGNFADAISAFYVVTGYPTLAPLAFYNIGLAERRLGNDSLAKDWFRKAQRSSNDDKLTALAAMQLRADRPEIEPLGWLTYLAAQFGYDENVNLVNESAIPSGNNPDSPVIEVYGVLSGPYRNTDGLRFDGSAYAIRYTDSDEFDQTGIRIGASYQWFGRNWRSEAGAYYVYNTLGGEGFESNTVAQLKGRLFLSSAASLQFGYAHEDVNAAGNIFTSIEGTRKKASIGLDLLRDNDRLRLDYVLEMNDRLDPSVSPDRKKLGARYTHWFNSNWELELALTIRDSDYDELLPVPREEDLAEFRGRLGYELASGWKLFGQHSYSDNDSSDPLFSYTRNVTIFGIEKAF